MVSRSIGQALTILSGFFLIKSKLSEQGHLASIVAFDSVAFYDDIGDGVPDCFNSIMDGQGRGNSETASFLITEFLLQVRNSRNVMSILNGIRLIHARVIYLLFMILIKSGVALADHGLTEDYANAGSWRMVFGKQWNQSSLDLHYASLQDRSNTTVDINENGKNDIVDSGFYFQAEHRLSKKSFVDLTYTRDGTSDLLIAQKNVRFIFFLLRTTVQAPVDIDVDALRLRYFHSIAQSDNFEFGGSGGAHALYINARTEFPVFDYSHKNYFIVLPCVGVYAKYKPGKNILYSVHADYLPIPLDKIHGTVGDVDFSVEYKINSTFFVGSGCRYSIKSLDLNNEKYRANASYAVFGGLVFLGIYL
jgi:hypothetical protein